MRVSLISTEGPWLEASISTPFGILSVMDEFTIDDRSAPGIGEEFDVELSASLLDDDESWESMFSGNPERRKTLEHIDGWSYQAFGEVVSIGPVVVDCGMIQIPEVFHSNDARIVGEFVSFTITRLDATQNTTQAEHVVGGNGG
ncbi:MAG: hypothetical protein V4675_10950 [Verrucomicrobiota bacterium]